MKSPMKLLCNERLLSHKLIDCYTKNKKTYGKLSMELQRVIVPLKLDIICNCSH